MKTFPIVCTQFNKNLFLAFTVRAKRSTGSLARFFFAFFLLSVPWQVLSAAVFTVTNTSGSQSMIGSLPWALNQSWWFSPGHDTINFNIPGGGFKVISIASTIPLAVGDANGTSGITIDGTTQPGYADTPLIWIDAAGQVAAFNVTGRESKLKGMGIVNFSTVGVALLNQGNSPGRHTIDSCWIGFHPTSGPNYFTNTTNYGHTQSIGIGAAVPANIITNNTISGVYNGITIGADPVLDPSSGSNYWISHSNYVASNRIGTTPDGNSVIGNTSDGVFLGNGATYNHIAYNVIGGNASAGVELLGSSGVVNNVYGNLIGVHYNGSNSGNGELGILAANQSNSNNIGIWAGNYVYYNALGGIAVGLNAPAPGTTGGAHYNYVLNNVIFANNDGGSQGVGVAVTGNSWLNSVLTNNIYGHTQHGIIISQAYNNSATGNWLGFGVANGGYGVYTQYSSGNWIAQNYYGSNLLGPTGTFQSADFFFD